MFNGFEDWWQLALGLSGFSAVLFVAGLIAIPWFAVRMPVDYLERLNQPQPPPRDRGLRYWSKWLLKNLGGGLLVAAGVVMLGAPGPGWGAILVGLALMSFPGKRRLEGKLLRSKWIVKPLNAIRARAHKPPLKVPGV